MAINMLFIVERKTFQLNGFITPQRTGYYDLRFAQNGGQLDSILSTPHQQIGFR